MTEYCALICMCEECTCMEINKSPKTKSKYKDTDKIKDTINSIKNRLVYHNDSNADFLRELLTILEA